MDEATPNLADNKMFHTHALNVIQAVGMLIEDGLKDPQVFQNSLIQLVGVHKNRGVTAVDIQLFSEIITGYLIEVLGRQATNSLPDALGKLFDQFAEAFEYSI